VAATTLSLETLDDLKSADLVVFVGADERPPLGAAGFVDWRLNGFLSRLMISGQFQGKKMERMLTSTQGRIAPERLFVFGLGDAAKFSRQNAQELGAKFAQILNDAGAKDFVIGQPGVGDREAQKALLWGVQSKITLGEVALWGAWPKV